MARIRIKTATRFAYIRRNPETKIPVVEVWIGGVCFTTDADSHEHAMQLAYNACRDLGLPVGTVET